MAWSGKRTRPAVDLPCRSHSSIGSQATQRRLNSPHFSLWAVGYLRSPLNRSTPHCKCCLLAPGCTNFLRDVLLAASCAIARRSCACDVTCHQPESILLLVVIETRMQQCSKARTPRLLMLETIPTQGCHKGQTLEPPSHAKYPAGSRVSCNEG